MKKNLAIVASLSLCFFAVACNNTTETSSNAELSESSNSLKVVENEINLNDTKKSNNSNQEKINAENSTKDKTSSNNGEDKANSESTYDVTLSYPSTAYIVDGNEEEKEIKTGITIESSEEELVEKVLNTLKEDPASEGAESVGLDKFTINKAVLDGGNAIIDFSSEGLEGSSMDEEILIRSIVNSLLSIKGVKSVEFTVDGETAETLLGHIETNEAFTNFR